MSSSLFIVLEKDIQGLDPVVDGKSLSKHQKKLDVICKKLEMSPLMEFFSVSPEELGDFMEGEGLDSGDFDLPETKWFAAEDGLNTICKLLEYGQSNPSEICESVVQDLKECKRVLSFAKDNNIPWHLEVDF